MDGKEYLSRVKSYIKTPIKEMEEQLEEFTKKCSYVSGQYDQDESFIRLREHLDDLEAQRPETHRIFYMALPPSVFTTVSQHLKKNCYPKKGIARLIVSLGRYATKIVIKTVAYPRDRSKSHSGRISRAPGNFKKHLNRTGGRRKFSVSIITLGRRWSRIYSSLDLETSFSAPPGTGTILITSRSVNDWQNHELQPMF